MHFRCFWLIGILVIWVTNALAVDNGPTRLFMSDGQLKSHPIRVFINQDIAEDMKPTLVLTGSHAVNPAQLVEPVRVQPMLLARQQISEQQVNDQKVSMTGTLMLFDLSHYPIPLYKTVVRLTPTLIWQNADNVQQVAIGEREVYLSNTLPAFTIPFILMLLLVLLIIVLAKRSGRQPIDFLCNDGVLSLSKTQVALWTVLIAVMVMAYGLMRLQVPSIPNSLIALMGLSLATGGISYVQGEKQQNVSLPEVQGGGGNRRRPRLSDLVVDYSVRGQGNLSMSRAQMVFWTVFTLFLFVVKSILQGDLWNVPWELVALMGLSQVSYLAPKIGMPASASPPAVDNLAEAKLTDVPKDSATKQ